VWAGDSGPIPIRRISGNWEKRKRRGFHLIIMCSDQVSVELEEHGRESS
jgi:hypothetical protein